MFIFIKAKRIIFGAFIISIIACSFFLYNADTKSVKTSATKAGSNDYIHWVDFKITSQALNDAKKIDIETYGKKVHLSWIDILSVLGAKYGGDFSRYKKNDMTSVSEKLLNGEKISDITQNSKYYDYYHNAYTAILNGFIGEYTLNGKKEYGLKAFSPIAKGFYYGDSDDFGVSRTYGFSRKHLGHDMMGNTGTPIIAIESGIVEAAGWNQYGGWRIGIRSTDHKRYYYYAHLRKDHPFCGNLQVGDIVKAGDVIGYMGRTGYSHNENVNNIQTPHLHMGIQLIFNEAQKDGNNEIWIDCYAISKFLLQNKMPVSENESLNEFFPEYNFYEPSLNSIE